MIPTEQLMDILRRLLERTKKGEVNWQEESRDGTKYIVDFGRAQLSLTFVSPPTEPDFITVGLRDPGGRTLAAKDFEWSEADLNAKIVFGLLYEAQRKVTKWDEIVQDIKAKLASDSKVGKEPFPNDDIPF